MMVLTKQKMKKKLKRDECRPKQIRYNERREVVERILKNKLNKEYCLKQKEIDLEKNRDREEEERERLREWGEREREREALESGRERE